MCNDVDVGRKVGGILNTEAVRPIRLKVTFHNNAPEEWQCHFWSCGTETYVDLFRVEDGKLIQFAALSNVSRVEELV